MDRLNVLVVTRLPEAVLEDLRCAFNLTVAEPPDAVAAALAAADSPDALLVSVDAPLGVEALNRLPASVRAIATYSVGLDHIDLPAARARGLAVLNTPGVLASSVAEVAVFLMLGAARRATESIELVRSRSWPGWTARQLLGMELVGKSLGVVGMGAIGREIAARARAFAMNVGYTDRRPVEGEPSIFVSTVAELAAVSDVLVLACPSTDETRGLFGWRMMEQVKPGVILVNIGRGDLVDDDALIAGLRDGRVAAAGLDVFAREPELDPRYFDQPNAFILPHIGSSTVEARRRMGRILIDGLEAWARGERAANRVD